ncbi:MAG: DUF445 domain-containing protein [Ignavibacteriales bacterium]
MVRLIAIPLISAFIGYLTNVLAIAMLFRPRKPVNILGYQLQGLIPKRQGEMAGKIGEIVERELLSVEELIDHVNTPEMQNKMVDIISERVRARLQEAMPKIVPANLVRTLGDVLESVLRREARGLMEQVIESGRAELERKVKVRDIVEDKILAFELAQMETLVKEVAAKELHTIEILGGVLGFIIGLIQVAIVILFP